MFYVPSVLQVQGYDGTETDTARNSLGGAP